MDDQLLTVQATVYDNNKADQKHQTYITKFKIMMEDIMTTMENT